MNPRAKKMRKAVATLWLMLIGFLLFASCLPDPLEVEGLPVVKPEIVVSTQIIPDQSLLVLLTKTIGALDASDDSDPQDLLQQIAVTDAVVTLSGPGGTYNLLSVSNGIYGGTVIPFTEGEEYSLRVVSQTLGEVTATTIVKPMVRFDDIEADLYFNGYDDSLAQITHRIIDPPGSNWYMINVQEVERVDIIENIINPRAFTRLLEDNDFDGQAHEEVFRVVPREYRPGDTIAVSLSNISKEYHDFVKLRLDNRFNFVQFLGEPVNYPSNVKGGKGFFNLYIPDFRIFVLE